LSPGLYPISMEPVPIARRTVADLVAARLRSHILSGALGDGMPLRQDAIAGEFGVSRIPVREALAQLEAEGLVRLERHRGAFVAELSAEDVAELFELRAAIEPALLRRALPRMTTRDLEAVATASATFETALSGGNRDRWGELNWRFHEALYRPAARPRTLRLLREHNNSTGRCIRLHLGLEGSVSLAQAEHRQLLELCRAREVEGAAELLTRHIEAAGNALVELLGRRAAAETPACA
jgi:DNA-binding GntR family transcriptional regulator